jgi:alpha-amylase/alpha-mannosidase (GH57 family)
VTERYVCIHGHFYQPPRENPWLESIEIQDSAYPYHDWNERITAECYAPNSASRILDGEGRIMDIVSNYSKISFDFGPTVLSWMEKSSPETYQAIRDADRQSRERRSGHGNAIAQAYNHLILPLANSRDKRTQVIWGVRDFEYRFGRFPEGMWLPETAVDMKTLDILAELGIAYTILAPHQAVRERNIGTETWKDVSKRRVDPTRAYLCRLPSGRTIALFFYDGPISHAVAFEKLLNRGEDFAKRLLGGFSNTRQWPQILHIATDGESYGHHHRFGDMALAYALNNIETRGFARLTNYGEYLEKYPPTHEVQIFENSAWSCIHGIERWRSNCGCNSGGHPGWNQEWRSPLREGLDWLRDQLSARFELKAREYVKDPWKARDDYIGVMLDRSREAVGRFLAAHAVRSLSEDEKVTLFKLLEIQRHAMLMYTSCGWFFDELSGIETIQVMQYAGRAIQLSNDLFRDSLEESFKGRIARAKSNVPGHINGAVIYEKFVKTSMIDIKKVCAHFAISSLFSDYIEESHVFSFTVTKEDYHKTESGRTRLATGKVLISSKITGEWERMTFCVLHLGNHALNGGVRTFLGDVPYRSMKEEITSAYERGAYADIIRLMDTHFGMNNYSLTHLFRDEQRRILGLLISEVMEELEHCCHSAYDQNRILMGFVQETGMPLPGVFLTAAAFTLESAMTKAFADKETDLDRIQNITREMKKWDVSPNFTHTEFAVRHRLEEMMERLSMNPADFNLFLQIQGTLELFRSLHADLNTWHIQNIYRRMAKSTYRELLSRAKAGSEDADRWIGMFKYLGEILFFNIESVLPRDDTG